MKRTRIIVLVSLTIGIAVPLCGWLYITLQELHYVRKAEYRVFVPEKPGASGEVYALRAGRYLVVLKDESAGHYYEAYDVDIDHRKIGLANAARPKYTPFLGGAFVDADVLEGYPLEGSLAADWLVNEHEVRIRITGFAPELLKAGTVGDDPEAAARKLMPVAYKTEMVLTKR